VSKDRNFFEALEARLEAVVERSFALAFPNALEPVHVARKLITAFEGNEPERWDDADVRVLVARRDFDALAAEREDLERQWSAVIARLAERADRPLGRAPRIRLEADPSVPLGATTITLESSAPAATAVRPAEVQPAGAASLSLVVRRGVPIGARAKLDRSFVAGREAACDLVLHDPRISRRHLAFELDSEGAVLFRDLASTNGVLLNGRRCASGVLRAGDELRLGDTELEIAGEGV
jgi:pSer/pThr/pTyr-binding forkhead associated (FHA) protein